MEEAPRPVEPLMFELHWKALFPEEAALLRVGATDAVVESDRSQKKRRAHSWDTEQRYHPWSNSQLTT
jgi:hypothetical protein